MEENLGIDGLTCRLVDKRTFILTSEKPLKVLTSAIMGDNLKTTKAILNYTVDHKYSSSDPLRDLKIVKKKLALPDDTVGMMTAVFVEDTIINSASLEDLKVVTITTVGVGNKGVAGMPLQYINNNYCAGTINTIVIIDGNLTTGALANGIITVTEAKVRALYEYGVKSSDGKIVTGTTTDTIVVACTQKGPKISYAGTATPVGYLIGKTVYSAIKQGLDIYFKRVQFYKSTFPEDGKTY